MSHNTLYVILELDPQVAGGWRECARASGTSAETAIRATVKNEGIYIGENGLRAVFSDEGTYIAVPIRSWKPITVRTETTTRVILEKETR